MGGGTEEEEEEEVLVVLVARRDGASRDEMWCKKVLFERRVCVCVCVSACPVFLYLLELTRIWFTRRIQLLQPRSGKGQRRIMWRYRSSAVITALIKIRGPSPTRRSEAGQAALRLGGPHAAWSRQNGRIKPRQQHAKCRCCVFTRRRGTSAGNWSSVI